MNLVCINCNQFIDQHSDKKCKECLIEFAKELKNNE